MADPSAFGSALVRARAEADRYVRISRELATVVGDQDPRVLR